MLTAEQERELRRVGGRGSRELRRLPRRRHRRVPLRARRAAASPSWRSTRACRSSTRSPRSVTGVDLVKLQLHVAAGGAPRGRAAAAARPRDRGAPERRGPGRGFAPAPGPHHAAAAAERPRRARRQRRRRGRRGAAGVRLDDRQDHRPRRTREEAIARLRRAVADTMVVIEEGTTNQGFLLELLGRPELRAGEVDTGWLDRLQGAGEVAAAAPRRRRAAAGRDRARATTRPPTERARFYAFARRGRPQAERRGLPHRRPAPPRRELPLRRLPGRARRATASRSTARASRPRSSGSPSTSAGSPTAARSYRTLTALQDADLLVEVDGVPHRISRDEGGLVRSHAPGVVVAIPVSAEGDEVAAGRRRRGDRER